MFPHPTKRAVIDVGHKCSIECTMCYWLHELKKNTASWEPFDKLKNDIFKAQQRGNNYIDATGGEPTLYPYITELINHATSLQMKFCIITNGITGEKQTQKILESGIDDWLVSVHHQSMKLKGGKDFNVRERQERFFKQVQEYCKEERPYRFNCCMNRQNQNELVETAKWAGKWKPRIFNFINMNPHNDWQKDIEGTRAVIGDLNVLEKQLCEAIPALLEQGCGVNVRYYPMCRLPEAFRSSIANDRQVLFDPYEWDYNIVPKTFPAYLKAAENMSRSIEWNGQPCLKCDLKFICGGINSAFYRADGRKDIVRAVKLEGAPQDDFYLYRRHNKKCLSDRYPPKRKLSFFIADETNFAFVPLFTRQMMVDNPEDEFLVISDHSHHETVKEIIDSGIGYGIYDLIDKNYSAKVLEIEGGIKNHKGIYDMITSNGMDTFPSIHPVTIDKLKIIPENKTVYDMYCKCAYLDERIEKLIREAYPDLTIANTKKAPKKKPTLVHYNGNLLIYTLCDKEYEWYIPLFARSMTLANPKQNVEVNVIGGVDKNVMELIENENIKLFNLEAPASGKYATASLRFLIPPKQKVFTHYLISDIDMLFMPENSTIIDQHCKHMEKNGTVCYENWISQYIDGDPRMPGVHFITHEWFEKTENARKIELNKLIEHGANDQYYYDEVMLGRIVRDSGLKLPPQVAKLWRHHGIHLGDWRINMDRKGRDIPQNVFQKMHIQTLLNDEKFIAYSNICSEHIPFISKVIKKWPQLFK
jgi:MoaA/NifB/PqqE/SkfB family radical SAM enzyme